MRIDKWLWAARFFKTRALAQQAIERGRVRREGERVKPAREVKPGDRLEVAVGELRWALMIQRLSERRGPASEARTLYEETEASRLRRETMLAERRLTVEPSRALHGRPTKRDRRALERFRSGR
jgi:ribosome-associated heat shock protein Hsp15